ncbi:unnamed protein product, partial [Durusdinium trenchii]
MFSTSPVGPGLPASGWPGRGLPMPRARRRMDDSTIRLTAVDFGEGMILAGFCEDFDFVVMAVGNFSKPFIPELNHSHFMGRILHSSELVDPEMLQNHHVVVVGYGKSALDCFILASKFASSATLVARRPAWILPQRFLGCSDWR